MVLAQSGLREWIHIHVAAIISVSHNKRAVRKRSIISECDIHKTITGKRRIDGENIDTKTGRGDPIHCVVRIRPVREALSAIYALTCQMQVREESLMVSVAG